MRALILYYVVQARAAERHRQAQGEAPARAGPAAPASWAQAATTGQAPGTFADPLAARPVGSLPRTAPAASAVTWLAWDGVPVRCLVTAGRWPRRWPAPGPTHPGGCTTACTCRRAPAPTR